MTTESEIAGLKRRLEALEAEGEIRKVVARYMEICDHLDENAPMDELGELFAKDAVWQGKKPKYAKDFGRHEGRDAIVKFLDTYRAPLPHFTSNVHFLTTEQITVKGQSAKGEWVMLQTPTFHEGSSYMLAARLYMDFIHEEGRWRISQFATENLFSKPIEGVWQEDTVLPIPQK